MHYPTLKQIKLLGQGTSRIPIYKKIDTNLLPFQAFGRIKNEKNSFLLESARFHQTTGRYSFLGTEPFLIFKSKADKIEVISKEKPGTISAQGEHKKFTGEAIKELRQIFEGLTSAKINGLPNFTGGAVGYFGYDCRHYFEELTKTAKDDLNLPDIYLLFFDTVIAYDHLLDEVKIISNVKTGKKIDKSYEEAIGKIENLEKRLKASEKTTPPKVISKNFTISSNFSLNKFTSMVKQAKEYIKRGDIYQANLSQRLSAPALCHNGTGPNGVDELKLYETLRKINPSPFACILDLEELSIVSSSPERLLKLEGGSVQTRPIAGTKPRGKNYKDHMKKRLELILSEKERAEHIMLLDLERNDLGRVCEYGSVRVDELMVLEEYSHVTHIVSNVCGKLRKDKDRFDLIKAAFPGGTITGTPKIRCMDIIDELEPVTRNIYTGSIGYLSFSGDMDLNIIIRTFLNFNSKTYIQVGAGIVADSDPEREYYETLYKAEALLKTLKEVNA